MAGSDSRKWGERRGRVMKHPIILFVLLVMAFSAPRSLYAEMDSAVPVYVSQGFSAYHVQGYEAGVGRWLAGSPYGNAVQLVSRIQYFKNIQQLYGAYQSYRVLLVNETSTSNFVYTEMTFERKKIYLGFTSQRRNGHWVLSKFRIDDQQKIASP